MSYENIGGLGDSVLPSSRMANDGVHSISTEDFQTKKLKGYIRCAQSYIQNDHSLVSVLFHCATGSSLGHYLRICGLACRCMNFMASSISFEYHHIHSADLNFRH